MTQEGTKQQVFEETRFGKLLLLALASGRGELIRGNLPQTPNETIVLVEEAARLIDNLAMLHVRRDVSRKKPGGS